MSVQRTVQGTVQRSAQRRFGIGLVVVGATLFILNSGVSRVALRNGIGSLELTSLRVTGTFVALLVVAVAWQRSALRLPRGRQLLLVTALGLFGVALLQLCYFMALDRLTISLALLLEYQAPILVALWAKFVQRAEVTARLWWGLALAVAGLAAATEIWEGASFDTVGVLAGIGGAICFAAYFLLGEACHDAGLSSVQVMLWGFAVATVAMNLASPVWLVEADLTASVSLQGSLDALSAPLWLVLAWVVLLGTLAPFGVELVALRYIPATLVTAIAMLEPVGAAALGWAWYAESLSAVAVLGCVAVVAGILLAQTARGEEHPEDPITLT
ncbi:EamA family transporter [Nocardioides sp. 616]|uniref:EamA family transporter n=1 Tax=Nocardioides sp. 616 TaxID=2268090 RepID=UPI000CE4C4E2|nr:EamA family transporter [Nocardioides sp. 616]